MNNFLIYLLQSGISLCMFYGVYWLFLRKETFFSLNRFILAGSVGISLLLPVIRFENLFALPVNSPIPSFLMDAGTAVASGNVASTGHPDIMGLIRLTILIIYFAGVIFFGTRLVYQCIRLSLLARDNNAVVRSGKKIIFVDDNLSSCSFLNRIFIAGSSQSEKELERIILHENAHIKNLHFIDLLLFEMAGILQWFNPVMWLFSRSIREIHEYEADREVLRLEPDRTEYQAMLVNQVAGIEVFRLANSFSKSITKKRMIMMSKIKSGRLSKLKALFVLPVMLCLVFAFSNPKPASQYSDGIQPGQVTGKVIDAGSNKPLSGAAVIIENTTEGTITGEDGKYSIIVSGDNVLVFSYVGFETQRIKADRPEINVKMQRKVYDLPEDEDLKPIKEQTSQPGNDTYIIVEQMPGFQGKGDQGFREYLAQNIVYPEEAKKNNITGKVFVQFTVNSKGEVADVVVVRSASPLLDKEAVRVVESSPLWEPGRQKGKPVDVVFTFPIDFKLGEK